MPRPRTSPGTTVQSVARALVEVQALLGQGLGVGEPVGVSLPATATRLATVVGKPDNIRGSWVEVTLAGAGDLNVNRVVTHNLGLGPPADPGAANRPTKQRLNVRWDVRGFRYKGTAASLTVTDYRLLVLYNDGAVTGNTIELKFYTNLPIASGDVVVTMFFYPSSG